MTRAVSKHDRSIEAAGSWNLKGIDPKARELARDVARRSGLTLAEWLNQLITDAGEGPQAALERGPKSVTSPGAKTGAKPHGPARSSRSSPPSGAATSNAKSALAPRKASRGRDSVDASRLMSVLVEFSSRLEAMEHRSTLAVGDGDPPPSDMLSRLAGVERSVAAIAALSKGGAGGENQARVAGRLDFEEESRLEAIKALEDLIGKVAAQIRQGEARAELQALQARENFRSLRHRIDRLEAQPTFEASSIDVRLTQLTERLNGVESAPERAVEASLIDTSFSRLMDRVEEGQHHALGSLRALEGALAGLEQLVGQMAIASPGQPDATGASGLRPARPAPDVDGAAEMATRPGDDELDPVEAVVRDLSDQVAATQHRSAKAINQMGREVIRIAQSLDGRVDEVERRSHQRAAEMGGEMFRLAETMDDRLSRADDARARALEELGGKITSVADQLADNIAASERHSAQIVADGLDDVGERLQRAIDKLNRHYERAASELADHARQREERAARFVAEACDHIDAAQLRAAAHEGLGRGRDQNDAAVFLGSLEARRYGDPDQICDLSADAPAPAEPSKAARGGIADDVEPSVLRSSAPLGSNRELIEQARAAARMNAESERRPAWRGRVAALEEGGRRP